MISHFKIDPQDSCFLSKTLFKIQCTVSCNLHFILYSKPQGNPDLKEGCTSPTGTPNLLAGQTCCQFSVYSPTLN